MQFFNETNVNGNIFSFYLDLSEANQRKFRMEYASVCASLVEDDVDVEMWEACGNRLPNFDEYFSYISKKQSRYLFFSLEGELEAIKSIDERKRYWKKKSDKITYFLHKIRSNNDVASQEDFINDLSQVEKDIEIRFPELLQMEDRVTSSSEPKIVWLGSTKLLATLFYDLWQGQKKIKGKTNKPLIKATKGDLMNLLANNFLDSDNKPLNKNTLSDYLNTSEAKQEQRVAQGGRIELDYE